MRAVPIRCQPQSRISGVTDISHRAGRSHCLLGAIKMEVDHPAGCCRSSCRSAWAQAIPSLSVSVGIEHDPVALVRQILGNDAPLERAAEDLAGCCDEGWRPRLPQAACRHRPLACQAGRRSGITCHFAPRTKPRLGVRLVELHRLDRLSGRAEPTFQRLVEIPRDRGVGMHHQVLADEPRGIGEAVREAIGLRQSAAAAACRRHCRRR